jgi:hypothetical protein
LLFFAFKPGNLCKHILFVLHKVLKVKKTSPLLFQQALLSTELLDIFEAADKKSKRSAKSRVMAESSVLQAYQSITGEQILDKKTEKKLQIQAELEEKQQREKRKSVEDNDCTICYEEMKGSEKLVFCKAECGNNFHQDCINMWLQARKNQGEPLTCPLCRSDWKQDKGSTNNTASSNNNATHRSGYINLSSYSSQLENYDPYADDSSYHRPWRNWRR